MVIRMAERSGKKPRTPKKGEEAAKAFVSNASLRRDPNGSYTGRAERPLEPPVQDADDL